VVDLDQIGIRGFEAGEIARFELVAFALDELRVLVVGAALGAQIGVVERAAVELRQMAAVVERDQVGGGEEEGC
jgi:hypothetical protein